MFNKHTVALNAQFGSKHVDVAFSFTNAESFPKPVGTLANILFHYRLGRVKCLNA